MASGNEHIYEFGDFRLAESEGLLSHRGEPVPLPNKAFRALALLIERNGRLVSKSELLDIVWEGAFVEEGAVAKTISTIRNALGEEPKSARFIQTIARRGYRFAAPVTVLDSVPDNSAKLERTSAGYRLPFVSERENGGFGSASVSGASDRDGRNENAPPLSVPPRREVTADVPEITKITRRRGALVRGFKFLLLGFAVGFFFLLFLKALLLLTAYVNSGQGSTSGTLIEGSNELISMAMIPVGLGWFAGIGLSLFGICRIVYALFEKENSKISSVLVERLIAAIVILLLLAVAIPNLISSYREAEKNRQIKQNSLERQSKQAAAHTGLVRGGVDLIDDFERSAVFAGYTFSSIDDYRAASSGNNPFRYAPNCNFSCLMGGAPVHFP